MSFRSLSANFFSGLDAAAIYSAEGDVIALKYENLADIGTIPFAGQTATKYFQLKEGDLVLLNDPYSGGTTLSSMTLVTPLVAQDTRLFLVGRIGFRPRLTLSKALEEEGLRIPPTPIAQGRELNQSIVDAVANHPMCPEGFRERIENTSALIWKKVDLFKLLSTMSGNLFSKTSLRQSLVNSRKLSSYLFSELPSGEAKVEKRLDTGEVIRLKLSLSPEKVEFDFANTSAGKRTFLTDAATFGACAGALASYLNKPVSMDGGYFSLIQVTTPLGSMLNSKFPSPTFKGMTDGCIHVAETVLSALSEIAPKKTFSNSGQSPLMIHFQFSSGQRFFDSLPGGVGASSVSDGADAMSFWVRNGLRSSVQEIESLHPLMIESICIRKGSGGKGQFRGGHGLSKHYLLSDTATFSWMMEQRNHPPAGLHGGANGQPPAIQVLRKGSTEVVEINQEEGSLQLQAGDKVIAMSAGGGGFGK